MSKILENIKNDVTVLQFTKDSKKQVIFIGEEPQYVDKLDGNPGEKITVPYVSLISDDNSVQIGTPFLTNISAIVEIISHGLKKKIIVFKYKPKKNQKTKQGHRQEYTKVRLLEIIKE
jgi:large subunit ribosomal protein L21